MFALVTGASRGIGAACAIELARMEYHVIINYKSNVDAALSVQKTIIEDGGSSEIIQFDVSDRRAVRKAIGSWAEKNENRISILVNNAGIRKDNSFLWMEDSDWDDVLATHVEGFFNVTKEVLQPMVLNKFGRVINIVSLSGQTGVAGQSNYSAAKSAVIGATRSLAIEVARKGVTVNAVAPGFITSDMTADLDQKALKMNIPMRRFGKVEDVANCVSFLASDKASYITGAVIPVNGGIFG